MLQRTYTGTARTIHLVENEISLIVPLPNYTEFYIYYRCKNSKQNRKYTEAPPQKLRSHNRVGILLSNREDCLSGIGLHLRAEGVEQ